MKTRIICAVLAVFLLSGILAGCADKKDKGSDGTQAPVTTAGGAETGTKPESNDPISTIARQDYDGRDFTFLTIEANERFMHEIFIDSADIAQGDVVYENVYRRNEYVNEYLNVNIQSQPTSTPNETAIALVGTGDTSVDVYNLYKHGCISLAADGYTRNWKELNIDFKQPWWNSEAYNNLQVKDFLSFMSGSVLITEIDDTLAMVYNASLLEDFAVEDNLYDLVFNDEWTLDNFTSIVSKVYKDVDGNDKMELGTDTFGYIGEMHSMTMNWPFACGFVKTDIDEEGNIDCHLSTSKITTMLEKLCEMFGKDSATQIDSLEEGLGYFKEGKALIYAVILRNLESLRDMEDDYGVLPYPKFDEKQKKYVTHVGGASPIMMIPMQNVEHDDQLANILTGLCEASYHLTRPAYFESSLKNKGTRDEQSKEILDLILDIRTYDLLYLSYTGPVPFIGNMIYEETSNFSSQWKKRGERVLVSAQELIDTLIDNNVF